MTYLAVHVGLALATALCFWSTGRCLVYHWSRGALPRQLGEVDKVCLGAAVWVAVLFILAAGGGLRPSIVVAGGVTFVALSSLSLPTWPGSARQRIPKLDPASLVLVATLGTLLVALLLQTLWPRVSWDANVYHLTVPRLYVEHGGFRRIPFNVYSNWPMNMELLFAGAMLLRDHVVAKLLHFGCGLLIVLELVRQGRRRREAWAGWLAAGLFLANPVVLLEIRLAYVDLAFALFFLLSFLAVDRALGLTGSEKTRWLLLAGVLGGIAAGCKLPGISAVACLAALIVVSSWRRAGFSTWSISLVTFLLPAIALQVPWFVKSWLLTGNPVYPFLFDVFGGPEWSAELGEKFATWQRSIGMGRAPLDYLLLPVRVILQGDRGYAAFDGRILSAWLLLIPMSLWVGRRLSIVRRSLGVSGLYFMIWASSSQQMRFLTAILPLLALAAAAAAAQLVTLMRAERSRNWARAVMSLVVAAILSVNGYSYAKRSVGMFRDYLDLGDSVLELAVPPVFQFINRELPRNVRILFINTNHGFFCQREYIADSFFEASQIADLMMDAGSEAEVEHRLRRLGVTHVLIDKRTSNPFYPPVLSAWLENLVRFTPQFVSPDGRHEVFELDLRDRLRTPG